MKKILLIIIPLLITIVASAQDKIYKKKGEVLKVKIVEVGTDEIKYRLFEDPNGPIYVVDKEQITKVEMENGKIETYTPALTDPETYADQRKHALKVGFLAPLSGFLPITYERNLSMGKSIEFTLGFIGIGKNKEIYSDYNGTVVKRDPKGIHFGVGYKLNKLPTYFNKGVRKSHIMQGFYMRPTINAGFYKENAMQNKNGSEVSESRNVSFGALTIDFGNQFVFSNSFVVDLFAGLGYAFDNLKEDDNYDNSGYHFSVLRAGEKNGLGFTAGFKVGWLIK